MKGSVCLIGAGCGDADLITVRGQKKLMKADVVVYDDLLDPDLLELVPPAVKKIYVGKRNGKHSASQEQINQILVDLALQGFRVCRLKGGDPFVFGRGGEEILALREAGIPWEVVPGVSSCIAIPEMSGIPVTHRGVSRSFHVITGHTAKAVDNYSQQMEHFAGLDGTLVFLMGLTRLDSLTRDLMQAGKSADTPAAVIGDRLVRGTLADIGEKAAQVNPPAIILVGGSAGMELAEQMPLSGITAGLTGTAHFRQELTPYLRQMGASVCCMQRNSVRTVCTPEALMEKISWLKQCNTGWITFPSPRSADAFFHLLTAGGYDLRGLAGVKLAAVAPGTEKRLAQHGIHADLVPQQHTVSAMYAQTAAQCGADGRILMLQQDGELPENGVLSEKLKLYELTGEKPAQTCVDYLIFGSESGVRTYFEQGGSLPRKAAVCAGTPTADAAGAYCSKILKAAAPSAQAILEVLINDQKGENENE